MDSASACDTAGPAWPPAQWRAASLRRRERAAIARHLLVMPLSWQQLHECPLWCGWESADRNLLCGVAGVCWLSGAMRACIDGKRLAPVARWVGARRMSEALRCTEAPSASPAVEPPTPLLPPAASMVPYVTAWGQALLLWDCIGALRQPLAQHFGWSRALSLVPEVNALTDWATAALQRTREIVPRVCSEPPDPAESLEQGESADVPRRD